ncbi:MAG: SDR family oxidoreductase [Tannerellaceae bacterium]|nr:SDR family oxidoreductase [Tannerellaceae bacterium]
MEIKDTSLQNPLTMYPHEKFPMQKQEAPGLDSKMFPVPDCGEETYVGANRLTGRKALITGGDSGIGRAVAIAFMREGATVAITYLPEEEADAKSLAELFRQEGKELISIARDLRQEKDCREAVKEATGKLGGIDILVLNAAVQTAQTDINKLSAEQIQKTFEVNVFSPIYISKAAIPYLPAGASVIFSASAEYYTPNKMLMDYAASKGAVVAFSIALSKYLIDKGIRVNAVCPGPVWTPLEVSGGNPDEGIPVHGLDTPMKRPAQPVELAGIYVFLASNESTYVVGEIYGVTGGLSSL